MKKNTYPPQFFQEQKNYHNPSAINFLSNAAASQLTFTINSMQNLLHTMTITKTPFICDTLLYQCIKLFHQLHKQHCLLDSKISNKKLATALIHGWHLLNFEEHEQLVNVMTAFAEQYNPNRLDHQQTDNSLGILLAPWLEYALSMPIKNEWITALSCIEELSFNLKIHCRSNQQQLGYNEQYQYQAIGGNLIQLGESYNRFLLSYACDKMIAENLRFQSEMDNQLFEKYINKQPIQKAEMFIRKLRKIGLSFLAEINKNAPEWFEALDNCREIRNRLRHQESMEIANLTFSEHFVMQLSRLHQLTQSLRQDFMNNQSQYQSEMILKY